MKTSVCLSPDNYLTEERPKRIIRKSSNTIVRILKTNISDEELEQFTFIASHNLQEPLLNISNYMQLFEEDYIGQLDDKARNYLHVVNKATKKMSMLIKSLLNYTKLGYNFKLTYVDCNELINDVLTDLGTYIKTTGTIVKLSKMPRLYVSEPLFRQLFQNLITNAIKFQKKGNQPFIHISSEKENGEWKFSVSDNGIGIVPFHFEKIFEIFQRLHKNDDDYEGTGIGLANCKKIVQLHRGKIWVDSKLGQGSTFYFTIP